MTRKNTLSVSKAVSRTLGAVVTGMLAGLSADTMAYQEEDIIVRAGIALVEPNDTSSTIDIETLDLGPAGNARVGVGTDTQLGITAAYMLNDRLAIELLAATPYTHDINGTGAIAGIGTLAETKHLPPTLSLQYYLNDPGSKFQPYIGFGINYTVFFDEKVSGTLDSPGTFNALANLAGAGLPDNDITSVSGTDIDLENSFGAALQLGLDYQLTDSLGINLAYWRVDIDTEAKISTTAQSTALGETSIDATVDVHIDPTVYMAGIYYKF